MAIKITNSPDNGSWEVDTIYYIRSAVMGGEVVSEAWPTGKKKKTFVMAAGTRLATQSEYLWSNADNKSVAFEHVDASGMSQRTTASNGTAVTSFGSFDGAPVETDPMGGNVGISTPYIQLIPPAPEPQPDFPFFQNYEESPMYLNGQRVSCLLDGMSISCSHAMDMLQNGSAIPAALAQYQNMPGFNFQNHGLGIFTATWETSYHTPGWTMEEDSNGNSLGEVWSNTASTTTISRSATFSLPNISWAPQNQRRANELMKKEDVKKVGEALKAAVDKKTETGKKCADFIERVLKNLGRSYSDNIIKIFERIQDDKGFYEKDFVAAGEVDRGEAVGYVGGPPPTILFSKNFAASPDVGLIIHEIIHAGGKGSRYTHYQMAIAAKKAASDMGDTSLQFLIGPIDPDEKGISLDESSKRDSDSSTYFGKRLRDACSLSGITVSP